MYREQEFQFVYEQGVLKPEGRLDLPEGARGIARIRESNGHSDGFWNNTTIEQLKKAQSPLPVTSLDDLAGDWPAEDSLDDFLESVKRGRN